MNIRRGKKVRVDDRNHVHMIITTMKPKQVNPPVARAPNPVQKTTTPPTAKTTKPQITPEASEDNSEKNTNPPAKQTVTMIINKLNKLEANPIFKAAE